MTITPASTSVTVEWGQVTNATVYEVKFSTDAGASNFWTAFTLTGAGSYNKTSLAASTNYWVKVTPYDTDNNPVPSSASGWVAFTTTA